MSTIKKFKTLAISISTVLLLGISNNAKAGIFVDPYLGYNVGWLTESVTVGSTTVDVDYADTGIIYGGRAGLKTLGFMFGLDYSMGSALKATPVASLVSGYTTTTVKYDVSYMGAFVGYELPFLLRAWLTYHFDVGMDVEGSSTPIEGSSTTVGVGFTGLPLVSLNAEYRMVSLDNDTLDYKALLLSVSLPFSF
mgnify:CR=1 FL=1